MPGLNIRYYLLDFTSLIDMQQMNMYILVAHVSSQCNIAPNYSFKILISYKINYFFNYFLTFAIKCPKNTQ